jgi:hypothetical protein
MDKVEEPSNLSVSHRRQNSLESTSTKTVYFFAVNVKRKEVACWKHIFPICGHNVDLILTRIWGPV